MDPRRPNGLSRQELDERQRNVRPERTSRRADRDRDRDRGLRARDRRREYSYEPAGVEFDGRELHIPQEVKERLLERKENAERRSRRERRTVRSRTPSDSPAPDYRRGRDVYPGGRERDRHRERSRSPDWPVEDRRATKRRRHAEYADVLRPDDDDGWRDEPRTDLRVGEDDGGKDRDGDKGVASRRAKKRGGRNRKRSYGSSASASALPAGQGSGSRGEQRPSKRSKGSRR